MADLSTSWLWDEADLQSLITNGVGESLNLDYKDSRALAAKNDKVKKDISKDVSAFANSAGGTLVYGMQEAGHLPVALDSGVDPASITREWIEQVINSTIQQRIDGVRINQVALSAGNVAYVVHVPQSDRAPHMASDHVYYKRFNYESRPMEEYEVRDIGNRLTTPRLKPTLHILSINRNEHHGLRIKLQMNVRNESAVAAEYYAVKLHIDPRLSFPNPPTPWTKTNSHTVSADDTMPNDTLVDSYTRNFGIPHALPLWQGINFEIDTFDVDIPAADGYLLGVSTSTVGEPNAEQSYWLTTTRETAYLKSL